MDRSGDSAAPPNIPRSWTPVAASSSQRTDEGEFKENVIPRKPLSPLSSPGRSQGVPMSPVTLNQRSDDWSPRHSTALADNGRPQIRHISEDTDETNWHSAQSPSSPVARQQGKAEEARLYHLPLRQQYTTHPAASLQESQTGIIGVASSSPVEPSDMNDTLQQDASSSTSQTAYEEIPEVTTFEYLHDQDEDFRKQHTQNQDSRASNRSPNRNESPVPNVETGGSIGRHLTPTPQHSLGPRPASTYSDLGPRGSSPGTHPQSPNWPRTPSANSGRTPDSRPVSYIDLLNVPYPQPPPVPIAAFDNSQLRSAVGNNASLLSSQKTLEMYRLNVKKTNDPSIQYAFAVFLITAAQEMGLSGQSNSGTDDGVKTPSSAQDLLREARQILARLADRSYPFAQYYLADGYASGLFNKGKEDYDRAFPLFVAASKHGHAESGYRAALCYEFGWGCRIDAQKAVQFYRQSASKNHPGAMTRLGRACLQGELGLNRYREGIKWLKRATEAADPQYNAAPYHLGVLYETGYGDDIFQDETYAAQLFTQAADLGHVEASYRLGDAYEHGKLSCPQDPALSVHFYTGAAQGGHPGAMMALCAWYMVGAEPVLEKDENEAYEWAKRAAECGKKTFQHISQP